MTEKKFTIPLALGPYYPNLVIIIDKSKEFKYCCSLYILKEGKIFMLCYCDNCHGKGDHIHFCYLEGEIEEKFSFQGFGNTIEYFKNHWKDIMERIENGK